MAGDDAKWSLRSIVYKIDDDKTNRKLLETTAGMYISIFDFGYPIEKNTFTSYILNDDGEYSIYRPRQWNHLCFAWSSGGKSKVVLVWKVTLRLDENIIRNENIAISIISVNM